MPVILQDTVVLLWERNVPQLGCPKTFKGSGDRAWCSRAEQQPWCHAVLILTPRGLPCMQEQLQCMTVYDRGTAQPSMKGQI